MHPIHGVHTPHRSSHHKHIWSSSSHSAHPFNQPASPLTSNTSPQMPGSTGSSHIHHRHNHDRHYNYDQFAGAEPGVNPRSGSSNAEFSHFKQECVIDVIDYDSDNATFQRFTNAGLIQLLQEKTPGFTSDDGDLPPRMVRWINIGGIDWSVLSAVALKYNLHSLALEDILHERGHNHSKADYYPGHLFIRILCHMLKEEGVDTESHEDSLYPSPELSRENLMQAPDETGRSNASRLEEGTYPELSEDGLDRKPKLADKSKRPNLSQLAPPGPEPLSLKKTGVERDGFRSSLRRRFGSLSGFKDSAREKQLRQIYALTKQERVCLKHEPMFIFLLRDGTVISIRPTPSLEYTAPITERIHRPDTVLRTSEDASLLVESLLDLAVDRILEMVDEYQVRIHQLEHRILLHLDMDSVRSIHILSGDLIMHKRTLDPVKTMIYGLRRYDLDRCVALAETMAMDTKYVSDAETESTLNDPSPTPESDPHSEDMKRAEGRDKVSKARRRRRRRREKEKHQQQPSSLMSRESFSSASGSSLAGKEEEERHMRQTQTTVANKQRTAQNKSRAKKIEGYFSYKAKVYLADVYDHMDFALTSLDMFSDTSENLINYAFNMASYEMNNVMKRLTLVTIIFLPLTLLTGYFGMNFHTFWSVDTHSDAFFWEISVPVMTALIIIFLFNDIKSFFTYMRRKWEVDRAVKGLP